ncbi:MAG: PQQ-dependent sugar dehydrogenase [Gammaproteobacteria bacterium]
MREYFAFIFSFSLLLSACGGSGSSEQDAVSPMLPSISIHNVSISEGDSGTVTMVFTASLSDSSSSIVSVDYATSDGSATAGVDYQATNGSLQFSAGTIDQTINVIIEGDTEIEANETLVVTLSAPVNATISQANATGIITTDDFSSLPGLDNRPDNQTCIAPTRPNEDSTVAVIDPFPGLPNISQPTKMLLEPGVDPRWFILRKSGQLVTFDPDNATTTSTYLDLSGIVRTASEGGLLGMAFHPDYPNTPEIFLSYTIDHSSPAMRSVVSRFILDNVTNPGGGTVEQVILRVDQDFDNHNGGDIAFGLDGNLYIGLGDGGSGGDPNDRAQDTTRLLGSMLRIDVLGPGVSYPANPYAIPVDNPFAGNAKCGSGANAAACPEIYAWGLRNPWRWSFDSATGGLWLADVGQGSYEEVDVIERGGNYGWRCREGAHNYNPAGCGTGLIDPVSEYPHSQGNSITGGYVYRGSAIPGLIGRYVFADYGSGRFWALQSDGLGGYTNDQLIDTNFGPTSFGVDQYGELYFTDINNGRLRKLVPAGPPTADTIPTLLSATGCTDPADIIRPYTGLLPYDINAPFWSDGAQKDRYIGLPNGTTITRNAEDDWEFPNGSVIVKNFRLNGNLVETRHLMRHPDGVWAGYTYEWNALQTEATRVKGGKTVFTNGQFWTYPSGSQCMECHTSAANFALGPETSQLNKGFTYPSTSRTANQLETIDHVMMFTSPLPGPASSLPMLTDPIDSGANVSDRARAYLHTNCSQCHRPGGPTPSTMDLRYTISLANTNACDAAPQEGDLGIASARLIAPGDAARSLIVARANRRDSHGMPPLGSNLVDTGGINLLTSWINGLSSCN